jgi:hypothetical protein
MKNNVTPTPVAGAGVAVHARKIEKLAKFTLAALLAISLVAISIVIALKLHEGIDQSIFLDLLVCWFLSRYLFSRLLTQRATFYIAELTEATPRYVWHIVDCLCSLLFIIFFARLILAANA